MWNRGGTEKRRGGKINGAVCETPTPRVNATFMWLTQHLLQFSVVAHTHFAIGLRTEVNTGPFAAGKSVGGHQIIKIDETVGGYQPLIACRPVNIVDLLLGVGEEIEVAPFINTS